MSLRERFLAVEAYAKVFRIVMEDDLQSAVQATRNGRVAAAIVIPEDYSRDLRQGDRPELGLVLDNTDRFIVEALKARLQELVNTVNQPDVNPRQLNDVLLQVVEIFPYVEYIEYLLPGTISLAVFVSALIGGGLVYIDDKARGFHEGYLVTPITRLELIAGMTLSGTLKSAFAGMLVTIVGSFIAGIGRQLTPGPLLLLFGLNVVIGLALTALIGLLMVRVSDPHVPRAAFGVLNLLLFFPSGAMYPIESFPGWLRVIAAVDPFTYAVHALRGVLLKHVGFSAIAADIAFLLAFSAFCLAGTALLFRRRL
jgi:ABC-2 type transport system permease protein